MAILHGATIISVAQYQCSVTHANKQNVALLWTLHSGFKGNVIAHKLENLAAIEICTSYEAMVAITNSTIWDPVEDQE